jgi:large conductance mechanosensitive channel
VLLREGKTPGPYPTLAAAKAAAAVTLNIGLFLNALINFLVIAFALFLVVKAVNRARRQPAPDAAVPPEPAPQEKLLAEIRDLLRVSTRAADGRLGNPQPRQTS